MCKYINLLAIIIVNIDKTLIYYIHNNIIYIKNIYIYIYNHSLIFILNVIYNYIIYLTLTLLYVDKLSNQVLIKTIFLIAYSNYYTIIIKK